MGLLLAVIFYLLGSFPSGALVGKAHGVVIWQHGSGNIGATNVSRVLGKKAGVYTLILDILKGFIPITVASALGATVSNLGCLALFLVLGHCISLPPILKGGKGVATSLGTLLALSPVVGLSTIPIFALTFWLSRIVSLASIVAAASMPVLAMLLDGDTLDRAISWLVAISITVVGRHYQNLQRLMIGTEPQFTFGDKK
jgi:glycerol-3-phosphate acyltransferase PlsY